VFHSLPKNSERTEERSHDWHLLGYWYIPLLSVIVATAAGILAFVSRRYICKNKKSDINESSSDKNSVHIDLEDPSWTIPKVPKPNGSAKTATIILTGNIIWDPTDTHVSVETAKATEGMPPTPTSITTNASLLPAITEVTEEKRQQKGPEKKRKGNPSTKATKVLKTKGENVEVDNHGDFATDDMDSIWQSDVFGQLGCWCPTRSQVPGKVEDAPSAATY